MLGSDLWVTEKVYSVVLNRVIQLCPQNKLLLVTWKLRHTP